MPRLFFKDGKYVWRGNFEARFQAKEAGFQPDLPGLWSTKNPFKALRLINYADSAALRQLLPLEEQILASLETSFSTIKIPTNDDIDYLPFQKAGIEQAVKNKICLIADDMGLGKTNQAIGISNYLEFEKNLIVCPASLRIMWQRRLDEWLVFPHRRRSLPILDGRQKIDTSQNIVISYELAIRDSILAQLKAYHWQHLIFDESHYLINPEAQRFQKLIGKLDNNGQYENGLINSAEKITLLSGTPIPNYSHDFYHQIKALQPDLLGPYKSYRRYLNEFCEYFFGDHGIVIKGSKNDWHLYNRLRGSGFMVRREKKTVLPQLPEKLYSLIVLTDKNKFTKVLEKEKQFDANEIIKYGSDRFPLLPQIRREMGEAKIPFIIDYLEMILSSVQKVVVGLIHTSVVEQAYKATQKFEPALIYGRTPSSRRQIEVDRFQNDSNCRLFIGNLQAAGVGISLTAASQVIIGEPDYSPHKMEQFIDRLHRIGQVEKVNIHILVVENSLDAKIMGIQLKKGAGLRKTLDGD